MTRCPLIGNPAHTTTYCPCKDGPKKPNAPKASSGIGYVFMHRRPTDRKAWPVLYQDRGLAERCEFRVSDIVTVALPVEQVK